MNCTILEFADVVEAVQNQNLNATEYVATCDEACLVMFGSGDPDISGPGVMIGYICQVTLTCIFGPLLPVLFWLIRFRMSNFITLLKRFLLKLRSTVYNINAFYAVSIIVAILVRIKQTPSILEVYFMSELMDLQISILLSLTVATVCDRIMNDAKFKNARVLYHAAICIASIFLSYKVALPKSAFPVYYEVALACHEIYQIKDVSGRFQLENVDDSAFKTTWIIIGASGGAGAVISSIGVLLAKYATRIYENVEKIVRIFIPVRLRRLVSKYGWTLWSISIVLLWLPYLVLITIPLFETQYLIKQLNGDKLNDNEWSYGQTTAVLLWMPFTWKLFIETIKFVRYLFFPKPQQRVSEGLQPLSQTAATQENDNPAPLPSAPQSAQPSTSNMTTDDLGEQPIPQSASPRPSIDSEREVVQGIIHRDTEARIGVEPRPGLPYRASSLQEVEDPVANRLRRRSR